MFFKKSARERDKKIMKADKGFIEEEDCVILKIKADEEDQIFSSYNYDNKTSLNHGLSDYIWDNVKMMPNGKKLKLRVHTKSDVVAQEVESAIKSHYGIEYVETKDKIKKTSIFALICMVLGLITIGSILLLNMVHKDFFLDTVLEIVAWVFVWDAVDKFFIERTYLRQKCFKLQQVYFAEVEIIKELKKNK